MGDIINAAWDIISIELSYEGFTFKLWHPLAFTFIITLLLRLFLFRKGGNE